MSDFFFAIILGVVEGLTEYIPVSSTAHIRIAQKLLDIPLENEFWKMFAVVIQLGAILAVFTFFARQIKSMLLSHEKTRFYNLTIPICPALFHILIAFIITAVPAFLLSKLIDDNLESLNVIGASLLFGGIVMIFVDLRKTKAGTGDLKKMSLKQAAAIGAIQVLSAVFPGVSRSMATIVGGQLVGLSRPAALEFSFLLSIPIMMAATAYDLMKYWMKAESSSLNSTHDWITIGIGFTVSYLVALFVVKWLMNWVKVRGFFIFGIYRILLGALVLAAFR